MKRQEFVNRLIERNNGNPAGLSAIEQSLERGTDAIYIKRCEIVDDRIVVDFIQHHSNITLEIRPSTLADFIIENIDGSVYAESGYTMYMLRHLKQMVQLYLERNLAA